MKDVDKHFLLDLSSYTEDISKFQNISYTTAF